jgi:PAS domain S-box-containing protein
LTLDLDARVVTVNPVAESLIGATASALTGRPATEVFHRIPEFRDLLLDTLRTRVGVLQASLMLPRADGRLVPVEVATTPLRGAEGHALGVVAILRDLTPVRRWRSSFAAPTVWPRWARWQPAWPTRSRSRSPSPTSGRWFRACWPRLRFPGREPPRRPDPRHSRAVYFSRL